LSRRFSSSSWRIRRSSLTPRWAYSPVDRVTDAGGLLAQKVDVNAPGLDGTPALHWVVRVNDLEAARLLLRSGAQVSLANRYGLTPLAIAAASGNASMIGLLLEAGADANALDPAGETPLMGAARVGSLDAVRLLLDRGASVDATDQTYQQTALMVAIRENHPEVVTLLIARGAAVNVRTRTGRTPQWVLPNSVPGFGHGIGIVRGGLPPRGLRAPIPGGMTPLLYAARDGRIDTTRILLDAGADIDRRDANDITPLIAAITNNHPDVARLHDLPRLRGAVPGDDQLRRQDRAAAARPSDDEERVPFRADEPVQRSRDQRQPVEPRLDGPRQLGRRARRAADRRQEGRRGPVLGRLRRQLR
jgi:hypothetical protein